MKFTTPHFTIDTTGLWKKAGAAPDAKKPWESLKKKFESKTIGFYDWPKQVSGLGAMKEVVAELRKNFDGVIIMGIGGSYLGAATIVQALDTYTDAFQILWLSNVDPGEIRRVKHAIKGKKFAAVVVSKSGNTVETLSAFFHFSADLDPQGIVVVTDPEKGELRRLAKANSWRAFDVPANIGGRFSVLSAVGLLPTLLAGHSAEKLIAGANLVRDLLEKDGPQNAAAQLASAQYLLDTAHGYHLNYMMPYQMNLKLFGDWCVQLWGESLGKKGKGFTPVAALGTTDQHSLLQLFKEGPSDKVVGFVDCFSSKNQLKVGKAAFDVKDHDYLFPHSFDEISHYASLATEKSLTNTGVPTYRISLEKVSEEALGGLFFFFETSCAFGGELYGVDAFDQPGVEEAKKLLRASL